MFYFKHLAFLRRLYYSWFGKSIIDDNEVTKCAFISCLENFIDTHISNSLVGQKVSCVTKTSTADFVDIQETLLGNDVAGKLERTKVRIRENWDSAMAQQCVRELRAIPFGNTTGETVMTQPRINKLCELITILNGKQSVQTCGSVRLAQRRISSRYDKHPDHQFHQFFDDWYQEHSYTSLLFPLETKLVWDFDDAIEQALGYVMEKVLNHLEIQADYTTADFSLPGFGTHGVFLGIGMVTIEDGAAVPCKSSDRLRLFYDNDIPVEVSAETIINEFPGFISLMTFAFENPELVPSL